MLYMHGGYWSDIRPTKETLGWISTGPRHHGITTVILDYALCPTVTIDEVVRQCRAAAAWVYRNAESFGGDRERIYVTGNSAGGHPTAMIALTGLAGNLRIAARHHQRRKPVQRPLRSDTAPVHLATA
jgi:arylformamidase